MLSSCGRGAAISNVRIIEVAEEPHRLDHVLDLHRESRATLGFLPQGAFQERADSGLLVVAVDDGRTVGYALYDLPREEIALRHLCVGSHDRGRGIAGTLVEAIRDRHRDRRGIKVRCRRDWPANAMWQHLGFEPVDEALGRSLEGHLLTTWWRDFGHPTLFTVSVDQEEPRVLAALDTNVALDLLLARSESAGSDGLRADWVAERARLIVTKHVGVEVNRHQVPEVRRRARAHLLQFSGGDVQQDAWKPLQEQLLEALGTGVRNERDHDDVILLAQARAAGAEFFISRDRRTLDRFGPVAYETIGLEANAPAAFLQFLWSEGDGRYEPGSLENTTVNVDTVHAAEIDQLISQFLLHSQGEKRSLLRDRLHDLLADPEGSLVRVVREAAGAPVALVAHRIVDGTMVMPVLRGRGQHSSTVVRQVLYLQRRGALERGVSALTVTDPSVTRPVARALMEEGFVRSGAAWLGATVAVAAEPAPVADALDALDVDPALDVSRTTQTLRGGPSAEAIDDIEQRFWPLKVLDDALPTYLVSIQHWYAVQLFDTELSLGTLFPRPDHLGISREHVYYRAPRPNVLTTPARILWYVAGGNQNAGPKSVRACSRLAEVVVERPQVLHRRFSHLGVYKLENIKDAVDDGRAMALRFTHTELIEPVSLARLREMCRRRGLNPLLESPWRLPEHMFKELYGGGSRGRR